MRSPTFGFRSLTHHIWIWHLEMPFPDPNFLPSLKYTKMIRKRHKKTSSLKQRSGIEIRCWTVTLHSHLIVVVGNFAHHVECRLRRANLSLPQCLSCFQRHIPPFRLSCWFVALSLTESCSIVHLNVSGNCATSGPTLRDVGHSLLIVCGNGWHGLMKVSCPILRLIQLAYGLLRSWQSKTTWSSIMSLSTKMLHHFTFLRMNTFQFFRLIFGESDKTEKIGNDALPSMKVWFPRQLTGLAVLDP